MADAVPPLPASVEVTAPVVFVCVPEVVPVTFTAKVHEEPAAKVAAERLTLFEPAAAVIVPPAQVPVNPLGVATVSPDGKVSVKPTPLREMPALGFDRLKVSIVVPFSATLAAPKIFEMAGGNLAGGGGLLDPDEPPPQAAFQSKMKATPRSGVAERIFMQTFKVASLLVRSRLFLFLVTVRHFIALRLGPNIHLLI
jgi:hypothetical protein